MILQKYKPDLLIALQWLLEVILRVCKALYDRTLPPITSVNTSSTLPSPSLCSNHTGLCSLLWTYQACSCLKPSIRKALPKDFHRANQFLGPCSIITFFINPSSTSATHHHHSLPILLYFFYPPLTLTTSNVLCTSFIMFIVYSTPIIHSTKAENFGSFIYWHISCT